MLAQKITIQVFVLGSLWWFWWDLFWPQGNSPQSSCSLDGSAQSFKTNVGRTRTFPHGPDATEDTQLLFIVPLRDPSIVKVYPDWTANTAGLC